ncbi:MAG: hydrogenase maturation protease [Candidatus Omnitrophica bacterium]|nr:hydrogenase maturation protease [Candidatus Omnitrophota bacterium]MCM8826560.1 hydrogenase maturation protease [Candidatus Omnitrophota bacterium]
MVSLRKDILIIGCGNILLGDEGIGVWVIRELMKMKRKLPPNIELLDGGTKGLELVYYIEEAERVFIIDAVRTDGEGGEIYRFTPSSYEEKIYALGKFSSHDFGLKEIFNIMRQLKIEREIIIFGIEPYEIKLNMSLSRRMRKKIPKIIGVILEEVRCTN